MVEATRWNRYLVNFDTARLRRVESDFIVIGSGNAGLRAAIEAAEYGRVLILSKEELREGSTRYAQGGIAVALSEEDRVEFHVEDTLKAGAGLCDEEAVRVLVEDGILRVQELIKWGARFDREGTHLAFGMEGAHAVRRVVHRGDATGEETENVLAQRALRHGNVRVFDYTFAVDLLTENGVCVGVLALTQEGELIAVFGRATILASGGLGQLFGYTSNPPVATGDGMAFAFRAGATLTDMEFVQFHPTTLFLEGAPRFLISEAVRGEGAILLNVRGERFMPAYDSRAELAPRDIVSRAILNEMIRTGVPYVYLDITHRPKDFLMRRFPTIYRTCLEYGLDISTDAMPVQPAAHFMMGGVWTDTAARTTLPGLFACGEVACTMVHGANRLASNSLLEGLVFGARAGRSAAEYISSVSLASLASLRIVSERVFQPVSTERLSELRATVTRQMWEHVGIRRDKESLEKALSVLRGLPPEVPPTREGFEYANLCLLGELIARAALERTESRGAHFRQDFPQRDDEHWKRRIYQRRTSDGHLELTLR